MGAATAKWPRWIFASFAKHLHAIAEGAQLPLVIETLDERTDAFIKAPHNCEVTIYGPHTRELSPKLHRVWVDIFVVVSTKTGGKRSPGEHLDHTGLIVNALDRSIEIREYQPENVSPALVGCLSPRTDVGDAITNSLLRASDSAEISHSVIEARFLGLFLQP